MFAVFSLYMVLSYGFNYFWTPEYNVVNVTSSQNKKVGERITLLCQADDFWEWCRWVIIYHYLSGSGDKLEQTELKYLLLHCIAQNILIVTILQYNKMQCTCTNKPKMAYSRDAFIRETR